MNTTLNVKIDVKTKQSLKDFAAELGVPVSSLVNGSIKQMLRERKVVFSTALSPTPYLEKVMREAEADLAAGRNITTAKNKSEALEHLRSL
jgi:antitoxin component of RelBE/YafQ-DinJ toxin-antitoxin module